MPKIYYFLHLRRRLQLRWRRRRRPLNVCVCAYHRILDTIASRFSLPNYQICTHTHTYAIFPSFHTLCISFPLSVISSCQIYIYIYTYIYLRLRHHSLSVSFGVRSCLKWKMPMENIVSKKNERQKRNKNHPECGSAATLNETKILKIKT